MLGRRYREGRDVWYSIVIELKMMCFKDMLLNSGNFVGKRFKNRLLVFWLIWRLLIFFFRLIYGDKVRVNYFEEWVEKEKLELEKMYLIFENVF